MLYKSIQNLFSLILSRAMYARCFFFVFKAFVVGSILGIWILPVSASQKSTHLIQISHINQAHQTLQMSQVSSQVLQSSASHASRPAVTAMFSGNPVSTDNPKTPDPVKGSNNPTTLTLAVPIDSPPFFFVDADKGQPKGLLIDLWEMWSDKTGVSISYRPGTWTQTLDWMKNGTVDAHPGLIFTEERSDFIDFIYPITNTSIAFFVHKSISGTSTIEEMKGLVIGVIQGSYSDNYLKQNLPDSFRLTYPDANTLFDAARKREIRVFLRSKRHAMWGMRESGLTALFHTHPNLTLNQRDIVIGVSKKRPGISEIIKDGMEMISPDERNSIEEKWNFSPPNTPPNVLTIAMHHNMPPLTFLDREGRPVGLFVDIWRLWSEKTGRKIEFLPTSWVDTLKLLKNGKADIHAGLYYSKKRSDWMAFSQSYYESDASLYFPVKGPSVSRIEALNGKRVGVVNKTFHESYLKKNYPGLIVVPCQTTQHMVDAIEKQEIDAFFAVPYMTSRILSNMGLTGKYNRMNERHGRQKFRAGVLKQHGNLLQEVDKGLGQISHQELVTIEEIWIPNPKERVFNQRHNQIRMTPMEEDWLRDHPVHHLAVALHQQPYVFKNDNHLSGIVFDYLDILAERLGVFFKPDFIPQKDINDALQNRDFDLFIGMEMPEHYPEIHFSEKLFAVSHVIVNRLETPYIEGVSQLMGKTVSTVENSIISDHIHSVYPDIRIIPASTPLDALLSTSNGTSAATICDLKIAGHLIADKQLPHLKIAAPFQAPEVSIRLGVAGEELTFLSLLNKAIQSITPEQHEQINRKWSPVRYEKGINWQVLRQWIFGGSAIFVLIIGGILLWNRRLSLEVSERKKAQRALKESEERYRDVFEFTNNGVVVYTVVDDGRDFIFAKCNRFVEQIENISRETLIGQRVCAIFPGYKEMGLISLFQQVHQTGEPRTLPVSYYKDDRISGWRKYFIYRLPADEIAVVYSDETQRILNESEKKKLVRQLHQSQKMESIGTLAGGIAHDFNNILGIIMGFIDLAIEEKTEPKVVYDRLSKAQEGCNRAKEVVQLLLRFSRQTEEKKEPVCMKTLLKDSLKLIRSLLPATIDIQTEITTHNEMIFADATQLHQLLLNLCTNAAHAMEASGGRLTVHLSTIDLEQSGINPGEPQIAPDDPIINSNELSLHGDENGEAARKYQNLPSGKYLQLVISDTGTGMPPEMRERIFDPYFTTKEVGKGTGMGLAIVSGVVLAHKGFITVESEPDQGTAFTIQLPVFTGTTQMTKPPLHEAIADGNERILLVDDERMILELEKEMLERNGYDITIKEDPVQALELLTRSPDSFDLLITDMTMPQMTGDQLIKAVLAVRSTMPIIVCTGFSERMSKEEALRIGAKHYMEKPLGFEQLTRTVRQVLDQEKYG